MRSLVQFNHDVYALNKSGNIIHVIPLHIPPLRERRADIPPLVHHLLHQTAHDLSLAETKIDPDAEAALRNYDWPGNVRELSNVLERALSSLEGDTICLEDLPFYLYRGRKKTAESHRSSLKHIQAKTEKDTIQEALRATNYNKARASALLGIHRTLLYKKMKKYNLPLSPN
jgi:transcriptional regulator with PAS, ATPase and Fis domain